LQGTMFQKLRRNLERLFLGRDPFYNDPYDDAAEQFYAQIYLKHLFDRINTEFRQQSLKILDLGCHTGRLSIPLAQAGHQITAIDSSGFHIKLAQRHAQEKGVRCRFLKGDGFRQIRKMPADCFDLVLCTEVLYQIPDFRDCLKELIRLVRAGGFLATSHRTRFFYVAQALQKQDFDTARQILNHSEGPLWGSYFNWQTPDELRDLYRELGAASLTMRPIGIFTGNGDEGMARLCNLADIARERKEELFEIESQDSEEFCSLGRYLFVIGKREE